MHSEVINEICPICHNEFFSESLCDIIDTLSITVPIEEVVCLDDLDDLSDGDIEPYIFAEVLPIPENLYLLCDENEF